jgi:transaldolase
MIKIPATVEGLESDHRNDRFGISVNVTLIFSLERHREVISAYLTALEQEPGKPPPRESSTIHSVAFFVSRVDAGINNRLDAIGTPGRSP